MATQMDLDQQDTAAQLLREGARLLYTVAAGQYWQLDDVNAWFERYNALAQPLELSDPYGVIGARSSESDPLVDQARAVLDDLAGRVGVAASDFASAVERSRQGGGS